MGVKHQVNDAKKFNLFLLYVGWEEEKKFNGRETSCLNF